MKKMKLFLVVAALFTLAMSSSSFAQVSANANANVTANLRKGLTIVKDVDMSFGIVQGRHQRQDRPKGAGGRSSERADCPG